MMRPLFAEFVGTFFLVFTVGCNHKEGAAEWIPASSAMALIAALYAVGEVSGGHLNPAVSLAVGLSGKRPRLEMLLYCVVQFAAGILAGLLLWNTFGHANLGPGIGFSLWSAGIVEITYTMMISLVMLNVRASKRNNPDHDGNQFWALAIGMVTLAAGYSSTSISSACINPAVTVALVGKIDMAAYVLWQLIGGSLAAILFRLLRPEDFGGAADVVSMATPGLRVRLGSEFVGTFLLVFTTSVALIQGTDAMPFAAAACFLSLVYAFWDLSGAHFNPAVTLAVVCCGRGKCRPLHGLAYVVAQLVAGVLGSLVAVVIHHWPATVLLEPKDGHSWATVAIGEAIFTALVALAVLSAATMEPFPHPVSASKFERGLAIGLSVAVGGFALVNVSGGLLNPAVSFGLALCTWSKAHLSRGAFYSLAQLAGGLLGSLAFFVTHPKASKDLL